MKMLKVSFISLLIVFVASLGVAAVGHAFKATLSGSHVVPAVKTMAKGEAGFKLGKDGMELIYTLKVRDIENVTAAHIHQGKKGKNGPPVANLFTGPKKEGKFSGVLSKGTITAADLSGSLAGKPLTALIDMIKAGDAYVNVHTDKHPDGEIRGQIK